MEILRCEDEAGLHIVGGVARLNVLFVAVRASRMNVHLVFRKSEDQTANSQFEMCGNHLPILTELHGVVKDPICSLAEMVKDGAQRKPQELKACPDSEDRCLLTPKIHV